MDQGIADRARAALRRSRHVQADVVELHDQRDDAVDAGGDRQRDGDQRDGRRHQRQMPEAGERDRHDLGRQDEVGADRALDLELLELRRIGHGVDQLLLMLVVVEQLLGDLLGRFEGEIGAADHQQRRDQERREGGQEQRRREAGTAILFLSEPQAILPMIGSSRSGAGRRRSAA